MRNMGSSIGERVLDEDAGKVSNLNAIIKSLGENVVAGRKAFCSNCAHSRAFMFLVLCQCGNGFGV